MWGAGVACKACSLSSLFVFVFVLFSSPAVPETEVGEHPGGGNCDLRKGDKAKLRLTAKISSLLGLDKP